MDDLGHAGNLHLKRAPGPCRPVGEFDVGDRGNPKLERPVGHVRFQATSTVRR